jgi:DNA-binding transcriptional LysR family regulator
MVENGLGVSVLPRLILRRTPYHIAIRPLTVPAYRHLGFVLRSRDNASLAMKRFLQYLDARNDVQA